MSTKDKISLASSKSGMIVNNNYGHKMQSSGSQSTQ